MKHKQSIFEKHFPPLYQAIAVFFLGILFMIFGLAFSSAPLTPWITAATFLLLYSILNSIKSLETPDLNHYWSRSISYYMLLLFALGTVASLVSGISVRDAASIKWIFFVLTISYLVFLSIMRLIRTLIAYFKQEDDNF